MEQVDSRTERLEALGRAEAETFLGQLFGDASGHLRFTFGVAGHFDEAGNYQHEKWQERHGRWPDDRERLLDEALRRAETDDVYLCPFLGSTSKRSQGSALPSRVLYADDATTDDARLMLVDSGGGKDDSRHAYALTEETFKSADLMAGNRRLRAAVGGDSKTSDNDVLRLPGTTNHKTGRPVRLLQTGKRTSLEALGLPPDPGATAEAPEAVDLPDDEVQAFVTDMFVLDALDEAPDGDRSVQSHNFARLCIEAGLTDAQCAILARRHRPTVEKYGKRAESMFLTSVGKHRAERGGARRRT